MDLGAGRRGVDMGPSALRLAGLESKLEALRHVVLDTGDITVPIPEVRKPGPGPKYLREIVGACAKLAKRVETILGAGGFPLVLGGDHSIALGTVTGIAQHFRRREQDFGLLYVDAHGDMNTSDSSESGNVHGMPLAALLGIGSKELVEFGGFSPKVRRDKTVLLGIRNVDPAEREIIVSSEIAVYTMRDIDERGMSAVMRDALGLVTSGTAGFHLSFDLDSLDPSIAPGTGTPVSGGIDFREAHLLMEMAADTGHLTSMEVAELNPILDARNGTGELAVDLILSALGKRIL
jgi:arginase